MGRLLSALYLLTSLVLLWTGFTFFAEDYGVLNRINRNDVRESASLVILDFTVSSLSLCGPLCVMQSNKNGLSHLPPSLMSVTCPGKGDCQLRLRST
jgi:hypothetical protein